MSQRGYRGRRRAIEFEHGFDQRAGGCYYGSASWKAYTGPDEARQLGRTTARPVSVTGIIVCRGYPQLAACNLER